MTTSTNLGWSPPHCPNRNCKYHQHLGGPWPYRKRGSYRRKSDRIRVQRFDCKTCGVTFSTQTFSTTYWLKLPNLQKKIFMRLVGCMGARQIARDLDVSVETVLRHTSRLARHCMLFHLGQWRFSPPEGHLVVDGFESFEWSQYHPIHHHVAVEADTGFFLYHTDSELRRKGRMKPGQKRKRAWIERTFGRPDPQAIRKDMTELLEVCLRNTDRAVVRSDDHRSYPPAIRRVPCGIQHRVTSSKEARTARNPLFPVNEIDLLIRHSQSNHKRETIAFSKRRQASAEKLAILQVWRNYIKSYREKKPGITPAMLKGMMKRPLRVNDLLEKRLFPGRHVVPPRWSDYYERTVATREIVNNRRHELRYAH